jgi:hypothetical protein
MRRSKEENVARHQSRGVITSADTDFALISKIVDRAEAFAKRSKSSLSVDRISLMMDLDSVHERTPLRLQELLDADESNFVHDVWGIRRHLNRQTHQLENCFTPRFVK